MLSGAPFLGINRDDIALRGGDQLVSEQRHVFIGKDAFVILVVGAFIERAEAGGGRIDFGAIAFQVVNFHALLPGGRAGDAGNHEAIRVGEERAVAGAEAAGHAIKHIVLAVAGGGDAAAEIGIAGKDRFGGFPDGGAVFVEGEFVEDEVAGKTAGGAGIGGEDFDAADLAFALDADFHAHLLKGRVGRGFLHLEFLPENTADLGAFEQKLRAVFARVGKHRHQMALHFVFEQAVNGPGRERETFADLPRPMQNNHTRPAVVEDGHLVGPEIHGGSNRRDRGGVIQG